MSRPERAGPDEATAVHAGPSGGLRLDAWIEDGSVWLTVEQMADLFGRDRSAVSRHVRDVYRDGELEREATCKSAARGGGEGGRGVARYNLDVIVSVGYRARSPEGTRLRRWATETLRRHLIRGDVVDRRPAEPGAADARRALERLVRTLPRRGSENAAGRAVLDLVADYSDAWRWLLEYDEDRLEAPVGEAAATQGLDRALVADAIAKFKRVLAESGEASDLFGNLRDDGLEGILGCLDQTMFGEALYRSREEKAAHLLYFVVKDHPFTDGNKRIGALLFLLYAAQEGIEHDLNAQALTALTLVIAKSPPSEKDLAIRLVVALLAPPSI